MAQVSGALTYWWNPEVPFSSRAYALIHHELKLREPVVIGARLTTGTTAEVMHALEAYFDEHFPGWDEEDSI